MGEIGDLPLKTLRVSNDKNADPNRPDDPQYIVRLSGQVITVSLETVQLCTAAK